jgi:serine/threonine protein kinase/formylglycine-generating enzyme required for sulfatase activity
MDPRAEKAATPGGGASEPPAPSAPPEDGSAVVLLAFYARYHEDLAAGGARPVDAYQRLFRGYDEIIGREYARLSSGEPEAPPPEALQAPPAPPAVPEARDARTASPRHGAPDPGDAVAGYRLLRVLGEGGMGTVYEARQEEPIARPVALKVIKLGMDTREVVARFKAERQTLALLEHPHIARVYDAGSTRAGRPFFAMELVPGRPITSYADERRLPVAARLRLFLAVCEAVQHAHQKGIIHRDLKASNILVEEHGGEATPKIIDFGIAKATGGAQELFTGLRAELSTGAGQVVGTLECMSPEQAAGSPDIDTRADIYSLGALLYVLLAGELPFPSGELRAGGLTETLRRIAEDEPRKPSTRFAALGERGERVAAARNADRRGLTRLLAGDLDWIVMKALEKDRGRRYASASELAADIRRHLADEPVLAGPPGAWYRLRKLARRRRTALGIAALLVVIALGAGLASKLYHDRKQSERSRREFASGEDALLLYDQKAAEARGLEERWRELLRGRDGREPVWRLGDEMEAWAEWQRSLDEGGPLYERALVALHAARETALPGSPELEQARDLLRRRIWEDYEDVLWQGQERRPEHVAALLRALGDSSYLERLEGGARLEIASDPPGAEVWCFRYEPSEGRLFPLPFAPGKAAARAARDGILAGPFLEVERVWERERLEAAAPLRAGDRLARIGTRPARSLKDFVAALEGLARGESATVDIVRAGEEIAVAWTPPAGRLELADDLRRTLGITFAAFPLEFAPGALLGVTAPEAPLSFSLPRGSYLLVLRREGFLDTRLPVSVPLYPELEDGKLRVRLLEPEAAPPGFIHVPAGWFAAGGDREVDAALPAGRRWVPDFLIARAEVTFGAYLEFVNAMERGGLLDGTGSVKPLGSWPEGAPLRELAPAAGTVPLVPRFRQGSEVIPLLERDPAAGEWTLTTRLPFRPGHPLLGVSALAALEYARWLGEQHGGRWRFRLPTDIEWEKAARGADRRPYVWGDYPVQSFASSGASDPVLVEGEAYPADESVYGVRDLAGSVSEPTSSIKDRVKDLVFVSRRGGSWFEATGYFIRAANRNGSLPHQDYKFQGIRLAADLAPP